MNFVEELRWRRMLHDIMPGTEELLMKEPVTGYIGFDPTADSLHVGSLVPIMTLVHFQQAGHKPIALVGGATGLIGDPSGKTEERQLLTEEEVVHNAQCIRKQLEKFLDFNPGKNPAQMVNNHDWFKGLILINYIREAGKHLTISYLINKGFIKDRLEKDQDISFTEFNYILMQAYDFLWLYQNKNCKLQMGGSDQWGNITAGTELIRKKIRGDAFGLTVKLLTKADGTKFGKTESGNVWLDAKRTSPYKFYQFWLNASDEDAVNYIRIFTLLNKVEIETLEKEHAAAPHLRVLQKALAKDVTVRVHSSSDFETAVEVSEILFGNSATEKLKSLSEEMFLDVMEGVPQSEVDKNVFSEGINLIELLAEKTNIFSSKGEARKMIQAGGVSINKIKVADVNHSILTSGLLNNKYLLVQKGKKNYFLVKAH